MIDLNQWPSGLVIIGGPCSVESAEMIAESAEVVRLAGGTALRGGCWKPRTEPGTFSGEGLRALEWLAAAGEASGLPIVTEVRDLAHAEAVAELAQVMQIGARNMQNVELLQRVAALAVERKRVVLVKRHYGARVNEWWHAMRYVVTANGERPTVVGCERGIRTFEPSTRSTLDVASVPKIQRLGARVVVDPSHAAGHRNLVRSLALAGVAAGANGLLIEVHPDPEHAKTDRDQQVDPDAFAQIVADAHAVHEALDATRAMMTGDDGVTSILEVDGRMLSAR